MDKRKLGRSELEVSPVCFGGNLKLDSASIQLLDRASAYDSDAIRL